MKNKISRMTLWREIIEYWKFWNFITLPRSINSQERMRDKSAPSGLQMMLNLNGWSSCTLCIILIVSKEPLKFIPFIVRHPIVLVDLASLAIAGSLGQFFIFNMITKFGSLSNSLVTTTRKFFTVLFSVVFFGNSLTTCQWIGAIVVFVGLFADIMHEKLLNQRLYRFKFAKFVWKWGYKCL